MLQEQEEIHIIYKSIRFSNFILSNMWFRWEESESRLIKGNKEIGDWIMVQVRPSGDLYCVLNEVKTNPRDQGVAIQKVVFIS